MQETIKTYQLLQQLLANTPDIVFFKDRQSRYVEFNDALLKLTGVPREVLLGHDTSSFLPRELSQQISKEDEEVMHSKEPIRKEQWVEFADGKQALMDTIIAPILDAEGNPIGLLGIGRDITDLMNTSIALKEKNLALEQVNRELDALIYHAAHDLRAPLTSLMGLVNILREEQNPERIQYYLGLQAEKINRLDSFIQDIVNLSKNSREGVVIGPVDLEEMFSGLVHQFRFMGGASRMTFDCVLSGLPTLRSDSFRLRTALSHIVSNAVMYFDPNKEVPFLRMRVQVNAEKAILELQDNGIGIADEHHDRLFEMFYRANMHSKGSGIGLYIVSESIQKIGGTIRVESKLGEGSTFVIEIPNHLGPETQAERPRN